MLRLSVALAVLSSTTLLAAESGEPVLTPGRAVDEIARYCIDTGGVSSRLEEALRGVKLPAHDMRVEKFGDRVTMDLQLSVDHKISVTYVRDEQVSICFMHLFLADAPATLAAAAKRFGISARFEDHQRTTLDGAVRLPNGLLAVFTVLKMDADTTGSMSVFVGHDFK